MRYTGPPRPREDGKCWGDGTTIIEGELPDAWGEHPADRWMCLMVELTGGGVYRVDGTADAAEHLLSPALNARIEAWCDAYDAWDSEHNGHSGDPPECLSHFPFDTFDAEGQAIAELMRAELPAGWTVFHQPCYRPRSRGPLDELALQGELRAIGREEGASGRGIA